MDAVLADRPEAVDYVAGNSPAPISSRERSGLIRTAMTAPVRQLPAGHEPYPAAVVDWRWRPTYRAGTCARAPSEAGGGFEARFIECPRRRTDRRRLASASRR